MNEPLTREQVERMAEAMKAELHPNRVETEWAEIQAECKDTLEQMIAAVDGVKQKALVSQPGYTQSQFLAECEAAFNQVLGAEITEERNETALSKIFEKTPWYAGPIFAAVIYVLLTWPVPANWGSAARALAP